MRSWTVLVALAAISCGGNWRTRDTLLELGFVGATSVDWYQTRTITRQCTEENPLMGPCGQRVPVAVYMPSTMVLHAVISALLPPSWRNYWQTISLGAEASTVWMNAMTLPTQTGQPPPTMPASPRKSPAHELAPEGP